MSDPRVVGADTTSMDFKFRLDDRFMDLEFSLSSSKKDIDLFVPFDASLGSWPMPEMKGLIRGLFSFDVIISQLMADKSDIVSKVLTRNDAAKEDGGCIPPYAESVASGNYGIEAGAFVFGPVFSSLGTVFPEGLETSSGLWETNSAGRMSCMPGIAADF